MWPNTSSIEIAQRKIRRFYPPYCANQVCDWHQPSLVVGEKPFVRHGEKAIARFPYVSPRFRCRKCRRTFAASYFTLEYWDKRESMYREIKDMLLWGVSKRAIARFLKCTEDSIRRKKKKIARWSLLELAHDVGKIKIEEPVAFDGLENFSGSQFEPNNLNHAVGKESFFIYDFNLSPMNRKGCMSPPQQVRKKYLEEKHGKFSSTAIECDSRRIFERLLEKCSGPLHLHSDNHYAYRRALKGMNERERIFHCITPGKVARNFRNRLFPINHTDMLSRHQLADFKRETIAFAKDSISMLESFLIFAVDKNYQRPCFWKAHRRDASVHTESPAMRLGLRKKILSFPELYSIRKSLHHVTLNPDWLLLFRRIDPSSRRKIRTYPKS